MIASDSGGIPSTSVEIYDNINESKQKRSRGKNMDLIKIKLFYCLLLTSYVVIFTFVIRLHRILRTQIILDRVRPTLNNPFEPGRHLDSSSDEECNDYVKIGPSDHVWQIFIKSDFWKLNMCIMNQ